MPATPVGQIPYPQGTDPPTIPADLKNLATATDSWVSGLDSAFQARMGAVGSRLSSIDGRISAVNGNLSVLNAQMTSGDTAVTSEKNALTAIENRLNGQDTTAANLQNRYNNDNTSLNNFRYFTPSGASRQLSFNNYINGDSSGNQLWVCGFNLQVNAPAPQWRASFVLSVGTYSSSGNIGTLEIRLCGGTQNASWGNFIQQAFYLKRGNANQYAVAMTGIISSGALRSQQYQIAVGCQCPAGTAVTISASDASVQYMQSGGA